MTGTCTMDRGIYDIPISRIQESRQYKHKFPNILAYVLRFLYLCKRVKGKRFMRPAEDPKYQIQFPADAPLDTAAKSLPTMEETCVEFWAPGRDPAHASLVQSFEE